MPGEEEPERRRQEPEPPRSYAGLSGAAYGALLVLGFVLGAYGAFVSSMAAFGVPWGALGVVAANALTCWLAGRAMGGKLGAAAPFGGWIIAVVLLSVQRSEGDFVITGSVGGYLFLFGGTAAAAAAVALTRPSRWPPSR
jgi:hypothetical protein